MVATYSVIECNVSIMCCCMPSALGVLRRLFPRQFGSSYPANSNTGGTPMPKSDPAAKPRFDDEIELVDGR